MRKFLQFGALGLQKPLEHPRLSYLSRLNRAGQHACCFACPVTVSGFREYAGGVVIDGRGPSANTVSAQPGTARPIDPVRFGACVLMPANRMHQRVAPCVTPAPTPDCSPTGNLRHHFRTSLVLREIHQLFIFEPRERHP